MERFKAKVLAECNDTTYIVSNCFKISGWRHMAVADGDLWVYSVADVRNSEELPPDPKEAELSFWDDDGHDDGRKSNSRDTTA
jgi:hypothetical protein